MNFAISRLLGRCPSYLRKMTYDTVLRYLKAQGFDLDLEDVDKAAKEALAKINLDNILIGRSKLHGKIGDFLNGIADELTRDSDYIKKREDLIEEAAKDIFDDPSKFRSDITEAKQDYATAETIDMPKIRRSFGRTQSSEESKEARREEARDLTWDDIRNSSFAGSIKKGQTTRSFTDFYNLEPSEASSIVNNLNAIYLDDEAERRATEEAIRKAEESAIKEAEEEAIKEAEAEALKEAEEATEKEGET